jgi:hypothetical protein
MAQRLKGRRRGEGEKRRRGEWETKTLCTSMFSVSVVKNELVNIR